MALEYIGAGLFVSIRYDTHVRSLASHVSVVSVQSLDGIMTRRKVVVCGWTNFTERCRNDESVMSGGDMPDARGNDTLKFQLSGTKTRRERAEA